ncbi:filamentous haemagglutinin family protein [Cupriavidus basilensis]|uniref:filamentous haemagglutinin family protein n=1 Tax=Cupriavidus basilensis TaxID=68895 RepID=UPI0020A683DA|nr:filamentous haemagglutinin family protein [Cupriavidus basilensis]MCP3018177.1 filamentous hemagglutinin family protein [Cupriavidus basilensis]
MAPLTRAVAMLLATGGVWGTAQAQQAFSSAWFAAKGATQSAAQQTGRLPNGMPVSALASPSAQQQQANAELQRSLANLGTAAQGIAAMQAAQASARAAAAAANATVPDGLAEGGLKIDTNSLTQGWVNANAPAQTVADGKTTVAIQQTADRAVLNWETFNVGRNTTVDFKQQADWAVLNRVNDPQARPSQIQGQIRGDGTVMVVNRNGVIFSGTSQVDTRNLVAAAARISDGQFSGNGIYGLNGTTPSFTDALGKVEVQAGARIATRMPATVTQGGGYVLLLGGEVGNAGTIATPRGQAALAAGDSFVIRRGVGTDGNTTSTTRGNEISPQFVAGGSAGKVANSGLILAAEGDVTLAGRDVQQLGVAVATTTVNTRGTVHLLNSAADTQGRVTLGPGAVTAVLIDDDGKSTALDSQRDALIQDSAAQDLLRGGAASGLFDNRSRLSDRRDQSRVEIVSGGDVLFQGDSLTLATGGQIAVSAAGRSFVANRAQLDVSGAVGVALAMDTNNVQVNVQGNEQRDAPGNRDSGNLLNANVWIDRRRLVYVPAGVGGYATERWYTGGGLLEVGGYLGNQGHRIGEWAAQGGTVTLGGKEVVTQAGSSINLSGGSLDVQTGYLRQTWFKGVDGTLSNANNAQAGVLYTGVYTGFDDEHPRWGKTATQSYASPLIAPQQVLQNGYTVGRDAGRLQVSAPTAVLEGEVVARVFNGAQQTQARAAGLADGYKQGQYAVAQAGALALGQYTGPGRTGVFNSEVKIGTEVGVTPGMGAADALDPQRQNTVWLDAGMLNGFQLGALDLASGGRIVVSLPLVLADGGQLSLVAPNVDVNANITAHGGTVNVSNLFTQAGAKSPITLTAADGSSALALAPGATIDARGVWVNARTDPDTLTGLAYLNGGNVTFDSSGDLMLGDGSLIDVSSGGAILASGKTMGGKGGNVTLIAGDSINQSSDGTLAIKGEIRAYGVNGGGTLTVSSPDSVLIGENAMLSGGVLASGTPASTPLRLSQPLTIRAGQPLPFTLTQTFAKLTLDVPAPTVISLVNWPSAPTAADWVVPDGVDLSSKGIDGLLVYYSPGDVVPAGTRIVDGPDHIPAGTVIPSSVFPNGIAINPYHLVYAAGSVQTRDMTYQAGTVIPVGVALGQTVSVVPLPSLDGAFFRAGFSNYDINGGRGVLMTDGAAIAPAMPVYRFTSDSLNVRAGSNPSAAMSSWLPPLFAEHPQSATLSQRGGASLALRSLAKSASGDPSGDAIVIGSNASIAVDAGQSIRLDAFGQVTVDGSLTARGGSISLINETDGSTDLARNFDAAGANRGVSVWVGPHGRLDVSGQAYTAVDALGRSYGTVTDGGTIKLGGGTAFVVIRPGAELNADGRAVAVDASTVPGQSSAGTITLAGNGGSIALSSMSGLDLGGNLHAAAGGKGAAGGELSVALITPAFPDLLAQIPFSVLVPSVMTVTQARAAAAALSGPGAPVATLPFGQASVSADMVKQGGFSALSLSSGDYIVFSGDVSLSLDRSLKLNAGAFTSGPRVPGTDPALTPGSGAVRLAAPYVMLSGTPVVVRDGSRSGTIYNPGAAPSPTTATLAVDANQIDVQGLVVFSARNSYYDPAQNTYLNSPAPGFRSAKLVSQGDIRFLPTTVQQGTTLASAWDLDLEAAQVYPATNAVASVIAGQSNNGYDATLRIGRTTATVPDAPLSVFGHLSLVAPIIEQGGIVRAPFGRIDIGGNPYSILAQTVDLLPGSVTSVSMAGLTIPYGGTIDGVTYNYNGNAVLGSSLTGYNMNGIQSGVQLQSQNVNVRDGAVIDLSGGGTLTGAGFVSGRGGSVNILGTPLINANPANRFSKAGDKVYAILPGYASGYAPVAPENGAGDPDIGQQITLAAGVPGLPAGTYTLLPSNYALLPGAYRVELGARGAKVAGGATAIGSGSYLTSGVTGIANTGIRSQLPTTVLVTPGTAVRSYSHYSEQGYSDFLTAQAALSGSLRPLLPIDGKVLDVQFNAASDMPMPSPTPAPSALNFGGTVLFSPAQGGVSGQVALRNVGEVFNEAPTAGFSGISVSAGSINAIGAPRLTVNAFLAPANGSLQFFGNNGADLFIRDGVTLKAGEIFLVGGNIAVGSGVTLSTVGRGAVPFDSDSTGLRYLADPVTVLALSNGNVNLVGSANSNGSIAVGAGSSLYAEGTLAFATNGQSSLDPSAHFGARNITLAVGTLNVGAGSAVAAAGASAGLLIDQALFNTLLHGDPDHGAPALQRFTLSAANAINTFGTTGLDATGSGVDLQLATPAIYGYGNAGDRATFAADRIAWSVVPGTSPAAVGAGGPGTGTGTLDLVAREIDLGQFLSLDNSKASRTVYGFGNVNLTASEKIVSAGNGSLFVYQAPSADPAAVFGQSGTGGNLTLASPLLTGMQKSIMAYTAGGALNVVAPQGLAPSQASSTIAGAQIDLGGDSVAIGSTILLPSGKLVVNAIHDIALDAGSRIDLSGQPSTIQRATVYGFGGTASFHSVQGGMSQAGGSLIDVSAIHANAGEITIDAGNGQVALNGTLNGGATNGQASGDFSARAGTFADFAGLNAALTRGGFFDARSFTARQGDLVVGDGVKAHQVSIATDGGQLTVSGTIDASGAAPGTIRLSAAHGLTLASSAVLDAHGAVLQVDSYGQPIEAKNSGHVELTAAGGTLTLQPGATIDLSTPDGVAHGDIVLNARRTGETSGDIAISASAPVAIKGANSLALNAFWTYNLPGGSAISQATLDGYDAASTDFIHTALGNAALASRMAGLSALGGAFHLRPGIEIASSGDLSTSGDIDLAGYRYGQGADRGPASPTYGAGEPMALVVRAGGNLTIGGSISDGFQAGASIAPTFAAILPSSLSTDKVHFAAQGALLWRLVAGNTVAVTAAGGWTVPTLATGAGLPMSFRPQALDGTTYASGTVIPYGTQLKRLYIAVGLESKVTGLSLQTDPGSPAAAATSARANMLAAGSLSASLRLVAGADTAAADQRALQATQALGGGGNLTLNDPAYNADLTGTFFSVLRTGTGSLDLLAGGSFSEATPYGVYTAGTQSAPLRTADGRNPYDLAAAVTGGVSQAWYPQHGGDLLLTAQQDVTGNIQLADGTLRFVDSNLTSNWLWRQGGGGVSPDPAAWWINFGSMAKTNANSSALGLIGFQGIGTLGGGNLRVVAGRHAGVTTDGASFSSTGLDLAVASTGRVMADGTLVQTGGGDLTVKVGGVLNGRQAQGSNGYSTDYFGSVTALRGDIAIDAGAVGVIAQNTGPSYWTSYDPRVLDVSTIKRSMQTPGPTVVPGDGTVTVSTRGDLVLGGAGDAGMTALADSAGMYYTVPGAIVKGANAQFTLWRPSTAIRLLAAGGDVAPLNGAVPGSGGQNGNGFFPGSLSVAAANGDIRLRDTDSAGALPGVIELIPSPTGQLELLAAGSIYGSGSTVSMSGADMASLATPARPLFQTTSGPGGPSNAAADGAVRVNASNPIAFGEDNPTSNLHAQDPRPALVYAGIDIDDLQIGQALSRNWSPSSQFMPTHRTWYVAAKPFEVLAGRDIVGTGPTPSVFLNVGASDITVMQAGRDIFYQSVNVAGPGLLQIQAGRNLNQGYYGALASVGDIVNPSNKSGGAGITVLAGVGANGPDYAGFARLYFGAANQLNAGTPLAGSGKVAHAYDAELLAWLRQRFGYKAAAADALAYFLALPGEQQGVFARQVYFQELLLGGREYNGPASSRYGSYLRGREAIATLFPATDARGKVIAYQGDITMFSSVTGSTTVNGQTVPIITDAGVHTNFGGDIQMLTPGGKTLVGVEGVPAGAGAGLLTQGAGDIALYSKGSILLGLSRIMTTFGGSIQGWSSEGDINAGRGAKTTVLYTPPKRVYDGLGNVTVSPNVPSSGAGIATLSPIPEVPSGDVDLVAPLGTIDAGEAGIRVSGNVNLAALQVVNAANVQVQGKSTGLPVVATVNVGAMTNASSTASQAAAAAQDAMSRDRAAQRQNLPSIFTVRMLDAGTESSSPADGESKKVPAGGLQSSVPYDPASPVQFVGLGGRFNPSQLERLTDDERRNLKQIR